MTNITVTSATSPNAPSYVSLPSDFPFAGYDTTSLGVGSTNPNPPQFSGDTFTSIGELTGFGNSYVVLMVNATVPQSFINSITLTKSGGSANTYQTASATGFGNVGATIPVGSDHITVPAATTCWVWKITGAAQPVNFANAINTALVIVGPPLPGGHGDITNPNAWSDINGAIPPAVFAAVPPNTNFPQNGDGRFWYAVNAFAPSNSADPIGFIGDPNYLTGTGVIQWSITQAANDGSSVVVSYSTNGGTSYTSTTIAPQVQYGSIQNGQIPVSLVGATSFLIKVTSTGGTSSSTALKNNVALAFSRNANEGISWDGLTGDSTSAQDPINYNCSRLDFSGFPSATLAQLRTRLLIRLGFASQVSNPPPGIVAFCNDQLLSAQNYLYRKYTALHTRRFFRWKLNPGQRFYSLKDNDEDVLGNFFLDPLKTIEWVGVQDSRNVWYPIIEGIPPQLYTMVSKPWRPSRYDIRQAIEVYPAPDQTYYLWVRGNFGLLSFVNDSDTTTVDSELVFLQALAVAKAHYGHPDANNIEAMANSYRGELIAGSHKTAHYIPGTQAVPPAVRPTLIQFNPQGS